MDTPIAYEAPAAPDRTDEVVAGSNVPLDRSMLVLEFAVGIVAATAAALLALVH
jgi:hypothetical protein